MSDVYTFTGSGKLHSLSTGCFLLFDDQNVGSEFGKDVFKIYSQTASGVASPFQSGTFTGLDLSGDVNVTNMEVGDIIVLPEDGHVMSGEFRITANPSSGVFEIDLPWESCFSSAADTNYYTYGKSKSDISSDETMIGVGCITSVPGDRGVNNFITYNALEYTNSWFCFDGNIGRCEVTSTTVTFSGDSGYNNPVATSYSGLDA